MDQLIEPNPFNFFDKVLCINMAERADRWSICESNFKKYNITNYERVDGCVVKGEGWKGCALSFCKAFDNAIDNNYDAVLFLEDDFDFIYDRESLFPKMNAAIAELPDDWDSLYFGCTVNDHHTQPISKYSANLFRVNSCYALHSVAFSKKGLHKIKNSFYENFKENWHEGIIKQFKAIDVFFAHYYNNYYNCYITQELLCMQRPDFSNIEFTYVDYYAPMNMKFNHFKNFI
jgi:hypothetical protein